MNPNSASAFDQQSLTHTLADSSPLSVAPQPAFVSRSSSLLFVDSSVSDSKQLLAGAKAGTEVHLLNSTEDAISQITDTLAGRTGITSLSIVSHGNAAALDFSKIKLDLGDLGTYANQLQTWSKALASHADILLYGCDVAATTEGKTFVQAIAQLTGADVAASTNLTGAKALGGDWTLEYSTGAIESSDVFTSKVEAAYQNVLATLTVPSSSASSVAGGNAVVVSSGLTVAETTSGETLTGAQVAITSNFNGADDRLGISGQSGTSGTVNGLSWAYNSATGILNLSGTAAVAVYQTALQQVTYQDTNAADTTTPRSIQFSLGANLANPGNGHFYQFVGAPGDTWFQARDAAAASTYLGLKGYLATLTSASENAFVASKVQSIGWLGGSDSVDPTDPNSAIGPTWSWVTGPEAGQAFWNGLSTSLGGSAVPGAYSNWAPGEPNNTNNGTERYTHIFPNGTWNDYAYNNGTIQGYVVEYGGSAGDPTVQLTGSTSVNIIKSPANGVPPGTEVKNDFNGDGQSDILWRNPSTGQVAIWEMNGTTLLPGTGYINASPDSSWQIAGTGDFNGDGKADILWRNSSTGLLAIWEMDGTTLLPGTGYISNNPALTWQISGTGDFNGDGKADILWRNSSTGQLAIWVMDGTTLLPGTDYISNNPALTWQISGTGDFNGDGKADILWRNSSTGQLAIWVMNGTTLLPGTDYVSNNPDSTWQIARTINGTGDANGDGLSDIFWRNATTDQTAVWEINGTTLLPGTGYISATPGSSWIIADSGDYNGDAKTDLLWRNTTTNQVAVWELDGTQLQPGTDYVSPIAPLGWQVAA